MRSAEGFRSDLYSRLLEDAIKGRSERLFAELACASGLPGTRMNMALALAFATECAQRGSPTDALVFALASMSPEEAPGASEREFLPVCGILALGARASKDRALVPRSLERLHEAADDPRFRVREAVPLALARIGESEGDSLAVDLGGWMDGFHHSAAVLEAMSDRVWLSALTRTDLVYQRLDEAFALARDAPRAAARFPGRKALVLALGRVPGIVAMRFGVPIFDQLAEWAAGTTDPELREAIASNLRASGLARFASELARVHAALKASAPIPRDPTLLVQGMRGRGKKRQ